MTVWLRRRPETKWSGARAVGALFSGSEAQFRGHSRGVEVGVTEVKQGQMLWVSVSIPVGIWLAAQSVAGGRVVDGWWSGWRQPRSYSATIMASEVTM